MISREGLVPLLVTVVAGIAVLHYVGFAASLPFLAILILMLVLFRDPEREIPSQPLAVVSPADGVVVRVAVASDPYLPRQSIRVTLSMSPYGVYTTRSPIEGKVLEPPNIPVGIDAPHGVWLQSDEGDDVVMVMARGRLRSEPRCYIRIGERTGQGKRCGFVHMGGTIDLYLPENSRITINEGDKLQGGTDIIAKLVHA